MKILISMDPGIIIPVKGYGGHERLVEMFAKEYLRLGHEVHLLITGGSSIKGCTIHDFGKEGFPPKKKDANKALLVAWDFFWNHRNEFDLVHNFGRLAYLLPILHHPIKKIMTYGREIRSRNIRMINRTGGKNIVFTACSANLLSRVNASGNWEVVYNAIEFCNYNLVEIVKEDAPLIFLGRIERVKGCHTAIQVAKASGNRLVIAGNISPLPEEIDYFEHEIEPHVDGVQIQYIGAVNDEQKNEWLGKAKALLFPIEWNEPFGIVMIEAMACGTPVIAFNVGSVNEVIEEGITGFKVNTKAEMLDAIQHIKNIERVKCRESAKERFDVKVIANRYLRIIDKKRLRAVVITTHQPAANPRALKEYEALKEQGFLVKFLYSYNTDWSYFIDEKRFQKGMLPKQDFIELGANPHKYAVRYLISRISHRGFKLLAIVVPYIKGMATARTAFHLWYNINKFPADIYLAHYLGALPAATKAAKKYGAKLVFDAEDFHRGEQSYYKRQMANVKAVEDSLLPKTDLITTASPMITSAYRKLYPNLPIHTINNVFSIRFLQTPQKQEHTTLRLFWFSQQVGLFRGLEVFIRALNLLPDAAISLTIMGNTRSKIYQQELLALANKPQNIFFKEPVAPEKIFEISANFDVGLAGEMPNCLNKKICLSNKIFTYLMAGNAILASDMPGQKAFMQQYSGVGFTYENDNANNLAEKIKTLYENRDLLKRCKLTALNYAKNELNWENGKAQWLIFINDLLSKK